MNYKQLATVGAMLAVSLTTLATPAQQPTLKHFTKAQRQELNAFMSQYLMENPKVIVASVQKMQVDQRIKQYKLGKARAMKLAKQLVSDQYSPAVHQGKVTLVEFFDYQCSVCHMMFPEVEKVLKNNPNVRVVFKEFPIFGAASQYAAKASIAARQQGPKAFLAYHDALFTSKLMEGKLKPADVDRIAKKAGLNMAKLKKDMNSPAVANELKNTFQLAQKMRLTGTPAFVILPTDPKNKNMLNKMTFIPGGARYQQLNAAIQHING